MKVADFRLFYLSSINPERQGNLETLGNWMLRPVHVLTGHGKIYLPQTTSWDVVPSSEKRWLDTVISIATVLPGLIIGTLAKFMAHATDKRMRMDEDRLVTYLLFTDPPDTPLENTHKSIQTLGQKMLGLIAGVNEAKAREAWSSEDMRGYTKAFKELLESESRLLSQAFEDIGEQHWNAIWKAERACPDYAITYSIKYTFLVQLYFQFRKGVYYPTPEIPYFLEAERRPLFFKEGTPEHQLRETFNAFLQTFEPICSKANDLRFCAEERIDNNQMIKPVEGPYTSFPIKGQLIRQPEIQDAILANQKRFSSDVRAYL